MAPQFESEYITSLNPNTSQYLACILLAPEGRQLIARRTNLRVGARLWKLPRIEVRVLKGRHFSCCHLSPLRGFGGPFSEVQGLTPLAIDCRPYRGFANSCGITNGICDHDAL